MKQCATDIIIDIYFNRMSFLCYLTNITSWICIDSKLLQIYRSILNWNIASCLLGRFFQCVTLNRQFSLIARKLLVGLYYNVVFYPSFSNSKWLHAKPSFQAYGSIKIMNMPGACQHIQNSCSCVLNKCFLVTYFSE